MTGPGGWRTGQPLGAWWLLPLGLAAALAVLLTGGLRTYGYTLAVTLAVAALVRLLLPKEHSGGLVVRSRAWDVVSLLVLSVAAAVLTASLVIR
ncbi:MAG: DUF3017 domain-containing protein [Ornithinimicrobium sp.]|uniref:DUF3017 domain-containing protein n=1 Tax=Ornithinimicrobium sp. TaxID=1977084 RepID=UPI003D9BD7E5